MTSRLAGLRSVLLFPFLLVISGISLCYASASKPAAPELRLRGEAPHLELRLSQNRIEPGEELLITGHLRGYNVAGSDFCLKPEWKVFGREKATGALLEIPIDAPVQCRDHEFKHKFTFTNAGGYEVRLELRTQGTRVRLQDWAHVYVQIGDAQ